MCWQCDHPDRTDRDYLDHMLEMINQFGWAVQGVERDRDRPPYVYTVGLTGYRRPEFLVTGMPIARATGLVNDMAHHAMHAAPPVPGEQIPLVGGPLVEIVKVAEPSAHMDVATQFFGDKLRALQVVHADDRGHWPWDVGYRGVRGGQPVLGPRSAPLHLS